MNKFHILLLALLCPLCALAQEAKPQNKPYIDLRPLHFGVLLGLHVQDVDFTNVGPQTIDIPEQGPAAASTLCESDNWNPGFSVGVLADLRINKHFSLRVSPTMHFGQKHLVFHDLLQRDENGEPLRTTQDMKNTYISVPVDLKFSALRFNNYRPYIMAGVNGMLNLSGKDQDNIQLKKFETMVEVGIGCDFYLPFFKFIPELKFCYGLGNALDTKHADQLRDANRLAYARGVSEARTKMVVLTFCFE